MQMKSNIFIWSLGEILSPVERMIYLFNTIPISSKFRTNENAVIAK